MKYPWQRGHVSTSLKLDIFERRTDDDLGALPMGMANSDIATSAFLPENIKKNLLKFLL